MIQYEGPGWWKVQIRGNRVCGVWPTVDRRNPPRSFSAQASAAAVFAQTSTTVHLNKVSSKFGGTVMVPAAITSPAIATLIKVFVTAVTQLQMLIL